jgi:hypothetical protein
MLQARITHLVPKLKIVGYQGANLVIRDPLVLLADPLDQPSFNTSAFIIADHGVLRSPNP